MLVWEHTRNDHEGDGVGLCWWLFPKIWMHFDPTCRFFVCVSWIHVVCCSGTRPSYPSCAYVWSQRFLNRWILLFELPNGVQFLKWALFSACVLPGERLRLSAYITLVFCDLQVHEWLCYYLAFIGLKKQKPCRKYEIIWYVHMIVGIVVAEKLIWK